MPRGDGASTLRFALRSLWRAPGFTTAAIASLAAGLALATIAFSVVNAYLPRSFPFPTPDRLYHVMYAPPGPVEPRGMSELDWRSLSDVVEAPITASGETFYLKGGAYEQPVQGVRVSEGFLRGLGVRVSAGRSFTPLDFVEGSENVGLLGHDVWVNQFGGDANIIGRTITLEPERDAQARTTLRIVGVLPAGFWFGRESTSHIELLMPLRAEARTYMVLLWPGVSVPVAEARITAAARAVATWLPDKWTGVHLEAMHDRYTAGVRPLLNGTLVACVLVLVIACANVFVLILLRSLRRQREMSVRVALGARPHHLLALLFTEVALLCAAALGTAVLVSTVALRALGPLIQRQLGKAPPSGAFAMSSSVLVWAVIAGIAIAVLLSFAPALMPWQRRVASQLRAGGRSATDGKTLQRMRALLIAAEVAGSLALLAAGGLMVRSMINVLRTDLGFETTNLQRIRIVLRGRNYPDEAALQRFYLTLPDQLAPFSDIPIAFEEWPPFAETPQSIVHTETAQNAGRAGTIAVGARYFAMLKIPMQQGREFLSTDRAGTEPVVIISATLARRLWPDGRALGQRLRVQDAATMEMQEWRTIVGIAADARTSYGDSELNDVYLPALQNDPDRFAAFYLRTSRPVASWLADLRAAVARLDREAVVNDPVAVVDEDRERSTARFLATLLSAFAGIALLLTLLGMYSVIAFAVQQREREVAIRIAIGATQRRITTLFLKEGGRLLLVGCAVGVLGAAALGRVLRNQLHSVEPLDFWSLLAAALLLAAAGALATWWPAARAARRSPLATLQEN